MESLTKNKKTEQEITELLGEALGMETDIAELSELTNGSFNAVYKVKLLNGKQVVLKIAPHASAPILRNEKNILWTEAEALRLVRAQTGVPAPKVFYYAESASSCDSPFLVMEWMTGEEFQSAAHTYSEDAKKQMLFELGQMTFAFHQIHKTVFGPLGNPELQFPTWREAFSALFQNVLNDGLDAKVALPFDYDFLFQLEEKTRPFLNDVTASCLVHGDLWLGNVLIHEGKISALLDFERALWGDPLMEYPFGLLRNNGDFLRGYQHPHSDPSGVSAQIRRAIYNLYHYCIGLIEKPYRGFKSGTSDYFVNQKIIAQVHSLEKLF